MILKLHLITFNYILNKIQENKLIKIELKAINLSTRTWCYYMIEKDEELQLMLIIHIISKINNSVSIILLFTLHDWVFYLLLIFIYLLNRVSKKKSVND